MFHIHPHRQLQISIATIVLGWLMGTLLMYHFERTQGWSLFESFYFIVITTATIGFGDFVPKTTEGRVLTMIYALFYVPIFLHALASMFASKFRKLREAEILFENTLRRAEESVKNIIK